MSKYSSAKEIFARIFPGEKLISQPADLWKGDFPLPEAVAECYRDFGAFNVNVESYGDPFFLPNLERLWNYQNGYRFQGLTNERLADWDDDWLVIADRGADPFIFSRRNGNVLFDYHGQGEWNPSELFADLPAMINSLAVLGEICVEANEGFTDEFFSIKGIYVKTAKEKLSRLLNSEIEAETVLDTLGWSN